MPSSPIPIFADVPTLEPRLGFDTFAAAIASAILGGEPPQFTVGVYGAWGSGKSSLLNAIATQLDSNRDVIQVQFDAWRYERSQHIILPLLYRVSQAVAATDDPPLIQKVRDVLLTVLRSVKLQMGPLSVSGAPLVDGFVTDQSDEMERLGSEFEKPYEEMREISQLLAGRRIVILIDDLDRCSSGSVVGCLEAINLVMDVPGFIFVLALDYDVLVKAVVERYPHTDGHRFIEKMVQVPVRVPRLNVSSDKLLEELLPGWALHSESLPADFQANAYDIAKYALDLNPRQIKRYVNATLVLLRIAERLTKKVDYGLLSTIIGLQLRWPTDYYKLVESVYRGDDFPCRPILESSDVELRQFATRLVNPSLGSSQLRPVIDLTETVEAQASVVEARRTTKLAGPADIVSHDNSEYLIKLLGAHGFKPSRRFPNIYTLDRLQDTRVRFGKTRVFVEQRDSTGKWSDRSSFLLTRDRDSAEKLILERVSHANPPESPKQDAHGGQSLAAALTRLIRPGS